MNINELFEKIQDRFIQEELNGEFILNGNCIVWEYNLEKDCEKIELSDSEDDELDFDFESLSTEEILQEIADKDKLLIEGLFDELNENDNWTFSNTDIIEKSISFKIF